MAPPVRRLSVRHNRRELFTDPMETLRRLKDPYNQTADADRDRAWDAASGKRRRRAFEGQMHRLNFRSQSLNSAMVSHTFQGAVNLSFVAMALTFGGFAHSFLSFVSAVCALIGFRCLQAGLRPGWTEIDPRHIDDELQEDLAKYEREWQEELTNRLMALRDRLRLLRLSQYTHSFMLDRAIEIFIVAVLIEAVKYL